MMAASRLDSSWPSGECEVVREAVMQWLPLECCQGKMKVLQIMQKVLTTARFTLEDRSHSEVMKDEVLKFDWPEVRLPPTDHGVAPVQRPCLCGQSFLDKYRSQYSYTASRGPAKQLHKYMVDAIEYLEKQVFNVNEEMEILSLSTKNILTDGMLLLQGAFVMEALAVA